MPSWQDWEARWDRQQAVYRPYKAMSLEVMMDLLAQVIPRAGGRVLDLAAGLGTITGEISRRWPDAAITAVDLDPVLLQIGQGLYGDRKGITWVARDLREPDWIGGLATGFDAIVTASALHWLAPNTLERLYGDIHALLKPGGYFLNSDHMRLMAGLPLGNAVSAAKAWRVQVSKAPDAETWDGWWYAIGQDPNLGPLREERTRRFGQVVDVDFEASSEWHLKHLKSVGFQDAAVVWQWFDEALVMGVA